MDNPFVETIKAAYRTGDLADQDTLKRALMFENFQASSNDVRDCLHQHAAALAPEPDHVCDVATFNNCTLVSPWLPGREGLARLLSGAQLVKRFGTVAIVDLLDDERLPAQVANRLLAEPSARYLSDLPKVWVCDHAPNGTGPQDARPKCEAMIELMMDLGLHHFLGLPGHYLLLGMGAKQVRKPHWIDARLAWYFDVSPDATDHGWTRSLRSGGHGYKEWITDGGSIEPDVSVIWRERLQQVPESPEEAFWACHKTRLEGLRCNEPEEGQAT